MTDRSTPWRLDATRRPLHQPRPRPRDADSRREYECALVRALLRARRP